MNHYVLKALKLFKFDASKNYPKEILVCEQIYPYEFQSTLLIKVKNLEILKKQKLSK